jgi:O-antigen/teichoic acid export membrane protein
MLRSIFLTLTSRFSVAGLNFLLVILCARWFGAEGMGKINLLKTELALLVLIAGFGGTASLAFLASRYPVRHLYQAALLATLILAMLGAPILYLYNPGLPDSFILLLPILVFLLSVVQIQQALLLGAGELNGFNLTGILLAASQLILVYWLVPGNTETLTLEYAKALRISFTITLIFSLLWMLKIWNTGKENTLYESTKACYQYGFRAQLSNFIHFFNYRLTYYFLDYFTDISSVGIFSLAVSIAESVWLISQSIATVQYMRVARSEKIEETLRPTLGFAWMSMILSALAITTILLLPKQLFTSIFSEEFSDSLPILYALLPGILAQSFSSQLAHYFAGRGMYNINLWGSLLGVGMNIGLGLALIPILGNQGAALTASVAYLTILIWQIVLFARISGATLKDFNPLLLLKLIGSNAHSEK